MIGQRMFNYILKKPSDLYLYFYKLIHREQSKEHNLQSKLIQIIINSSDPEELKNKIVKEVAIALGANRCFVLEYDSTKNNFKKITNSYNAKRDSLNILGYDYEINLPNFAAKQKYLQTNVIEDTDIYIKKNKLENTSEGNYFKIYNIKSSLSIRLAFGDHFLGVLVIHYDEKKPFIQYIDLNLLKNMAEYISIALHLSTLYVDEKAEKEKELLLRAIISIMSSDYNLSEVIKKIFEILDKIYNSQSVFVNINVEPVENFFEYKADNISSYSKENIFNIYYLPEFDLIKNQIHYIEDTYNFIIQNNMENSQIEKFFLDHDIKSLVLLPILYESIPYGLLIIHFDRINPINRDDLTFIKTIIGQLAIAIKQISNYEQERKVAEREALLRKVTETIRSSLEIDETLEIITYELAKLFKVERAAIFEIPNQHEFHNFITKKEYKSDESLKSPQDSDISTQIAEIIGKKLFETKGPVIIGNIEQSDSPQILKDLYKQLNIKSLLWFPIISKNEVWGFVTLTKYNDYKHWEDEDIKILINISNQISIAINQAELYEKEKLAAERERISRNIIEILRSSIDKVIIKKLFVKNIGKFFDADRVFLSEYDPETKTYLPVDKDSEYLANIKEKSFINYDWSKSEIYEHIKYLLEKREIKISNWEEYIRENPYQKEIYISLYGDSVAKSSYKFPILYQDNIMGYFCIEFTKRSYKLSNEDINRIRSICTQAGIALYHSGLYSKAQHCLYSKEENIIDFLDKIKTPTNNILDISILLLQKEFTKPEQIEYLNNIISSCNQLLDLTKNMK